MGELVSKGTPPPHRCDAERPYVSDVNVDAVWHCSCGLYYKKKMVRHFGFSDERGEEEWDSPEWVEVKDAHGTEWRTVEVPREQYIERTGVFWAICRDHGRVGRHHAHRTRV